MSWCKSFNIGAVADQPVSHTEIAICYPFFWCEASEDNTISWRGNVIRAKVEPQWTLLSCLCSNQKSWKEWVWGSLLSCQYVSGKFILSKCIAESITTLTDCRTIQPRRPLSTSYTTVCTQLAKPYRAKSSCDQLIDSATHLLKINLPNMSESSSIQMRAVCHKYIQYSETTWCIRIHCSLRHALGWTQKS